MGARDGRETRFLELGQVQVIHSLLNRQIELPCNLEPPEADDSVSLVLWYKDKSMVPIYR